MKGIRIVAGALVSWGIVMGGAAWAGGGLEYLSETMTSTPIESSRFAPSAANGEIVVVVTEKEGQATGTEIIVTGGPSQSVRIVAPSDVSATAVGGAGAAGTPGEAGAAK